MISTSNSRLSDITDVAVVCLIHHCILEYLFGFLFGGLMETEGTVTPHKIVNIDDIPRTKSILA